MLRRLLFCLVLLSIVSSMSFPSASHALPTARSAAPRAETTAPSAPAAAAQPPAPIPGGCIGVTPPGEEETSCCISGYVYIDGQIVAGAEVRISTASGAQVTLYTQVYSTSTALPHYRLDLNAPPLNVVAGETITVTARYSSHERSRAYVVQAGGQQVDVVLSRNYADDYVLEREIWGQGEPGNFNGLRDVDINSQGYIYAVDTGNARIQILNPNGIPAGQFGTMGMLPGQFMQPYSVAIDQTDTVYVLDRGTGYIQKFDRNGIFIVRWDSRGNGTQLGPAYWSGVERIDIGPDGRVYLLTYNSVHVYTSTGIWVNTWGSYGSNNSELNNPHGFFLDDTGYIYIADTGNNRIQKFTVTGTWLATWGSSGSGNGQFSVPEDIAVDSAGNMYVMDGQNFRIQKLDSNGNWITSWGSAGSENGQFYHSGGIAVDATGAVYLADANQRIQKFTGDGVWLASWGSRGRANGQLSSPRGIVLANDGGIYVLDSYNNRVQKFNSNGQWATSWGSAGTQNGQLKDAGGIAIDSFGNIYVADGDNHRIQKFTSTGVWINSWGEPGTGNGQFSNLQKVAVDSHGDVYVIGGLNRIQKFTNSGTWIKNWGQEGSGNGEFKDPQGIFIDQNDIIYVSDTGNNRIQKFSKEGVWLESWGSFGWDNGFFSVPKSVALDKNSNVYVYEGLSRIQKFTNNGVWLSSWVGRSNSTLSDIKIDVNNKVYVTSESPDKILIFRPMTYTKPIATITHASATSLGQADTLVLRGMGQDSDQTPAISAYQWTSDRNGVIGSAATLSRLASTLASGTHQISLRVQDGEGVWSDAVTTSIFIAEPSQASWTMLLYLAGDFHDREKQLAVFNATINALRTTFRNPAVRVAIQVDGPTTGDTRRLLISPGTSTTLPTVLETNIGELAMDHPNTLRDFIIWGQDAFPAPNYYLAIANHGQAVQGIAWDTTSDMLDDGSQNDSAYLTVKELGEALSAPNVAPIALLHLDACAMNLLETAYEVRTRVGILIASQYLAWNYFAYDQYQQAMGANTSPRTVALGITQRYAVRAEQDDVPYTIAALDLSRAGTTLTAVDRLAAELAALVNNSATNRTLLDGIWQQSQRFESNGDYQISQLDMYVDVVDWATRILVGVSSPAVKAEAATLINELTGPQPFILADSHHAQSQALPPQYAGGAYIDVADAHGLSIFYPRQANSVVYDNYINNRLFSFTSQSRWADFLTAGVGASPPGPLVPPPGPLPALDLRRVYLPFLTK